MTYHTQHGLLYVSAQATRHASVGWAHQPQPWGAPKGESLSKHGCSISVESRADVGGVLGPSVAALRMCAGALRGGVLLPTPPSGGTPMVAPVATAEALPGAGTKPRWAYPPRAYPPWFG